MEMEAFIHAVNFAKRDPNKNTYSLIKIGEPHIIEIRCLNSDNFANTSLNTLIQIHPESIGGDIFSILGNIKTRDIFDLMIINESPPDGSIFKLDHQGFEWNLQWFSHSNLRILFKVNVDSFKEMYGDIKVSCRKWEIKLITSYHRHQYRLSVLFKPYEWQDEEHLFLNDLNEFYKKKEKIQKIIHKSKHYQFQLFLLQKQLSSEQSKSLISKNNPHQDQYAVNEANRFTKEKSIFVHEKEETNKKIKMLYNQLNRMKKVKLAKWGENNKFLNSTTSKTTKQSKNSVCGESVQVNEQLEVINFISNVLNNEGYQQKYNSNFKMFSKLTNDQLLMWFTTVGLGTVCQSMGKMNGETYLKLTSEEQFDLLKEDKEVLDILLGVKKFETKILFVEFKENQSEYNQGTSREIVVSSLDLNEFFYTLCYDFNIEVPILNSIKIKLLKDEGERDINQTVLVQLPSFAHYKLISKKDRGQLNILIVEKKKN